MKKIKNLMIALALLICSSLVLNACLVIEKTAITSGMFIAIMEEKGFNISVESNRDLVFYDVIGAYVASKDDCVVEFYELRTIDEAYDLYNDLERDFRFDYSGSTSSTNAKNYDTYECSGSKGYVFLGRVDDTLMVIEVDSSLKDTAKSIVKELGY